MRSYSLRSFEGYLNEMAVALQSKPCTCIYIYAHDRLYVYLFISNALQANHTIPLIYRHVHISLIYNFTVSYRDGPVPDHLRVPRPALALDLDND